MIDLQVLNPTKSVLVEKTGNGFILTSFAEDSSPKRIVFEGGPSTTEEVAGIKVEEQDYDTTVQMLYTLLGLLDLLPSTLSKKSILIYPVDKEDLKSLKE